MPEMCNDPWIWTPQMEEWFARHFLAPEPECGSTRVLARLLPDLPSEIRVEDPPPLLAADLLV